MLARLEAAGLVPAPAADRRTLIRRATFDLTGLPPSPAEVAAFVADDAPDAYERLIDRLLESPAYGEQWARHWLDVARYADTKGYVYAREERVWVQAPAYRDWVVQAFNRDLPYDRFLLLQLAAEQAAPEDPASWAAMGFLTLGRRFLGVTHDIIDDRIDVVTRGTLGLTVACAVPRPQIRSDPDRRLLRALRRVLELGRAASGRGRAAGADGGLRSLRPGIAKAAAGTARGDGRQTAGSGRARARAVIDYLVAQTELSRYPQEGFDQIIQASDLVPTFVRRWEAYLAFPARESDPVWLPWRRLAARADAEFAGRSAERLAELAQASPPASARVLAALSHRPRRAASWPSAYGKLLAEVDAQWRAACTAAATAGKPAPSICPTPTKKRCGGRSMPPTRRAWCPTNRL